MTTKRLRVCVGAAAALVLFSPPASPQLLQKLTTQVQSTLGTIACPEGTVWGNVAPIANGNGSPPDGV